MVLKLASVLVCAAVPVALAAEDPEQLLRAAEHYAGVRNLDKARPFFAEAEMLFHDRGDERNELRARFGRLEPLKLVNEPPAKTLPALNTEFDG